MRSPEVGSSPLGVMMQPNKCRNCEALFEREIRAVNPRDYGDVYYADDPSLCLNCDRDRLVEKSRCHWFLGYCLQALNEEASAGEAQYASIGVWPSKYDIRFRLQDRLHKELGLGYKEAHNRFVAWCLLRELTGLALDEALLFEGASS